MEQGSILARVEKEFEERKLSENERKELLKKLWEKYASLLLESVEQSRLRRPDGPTRIEPADVKLAAEIVGAVIIDERIVEESIKKAKEWLIKQSRDGIWGWWSSFDPPTLRDSIMKIWSTAISIKALLRTRMPANAPQVACGIAWLIENRALGLDPCWSALPNMYRGKGYDYYLTPNTYETSCVLTTLMEVPEPSSSLRNIIQMGLENLIHFQRKGGYWPIFLTKEEEGRDDADVGATSLASIAVSRAKTKAFDCEKMNESIISSVEWLVANRRRGCGSWGDLNYPQKHGNTAKTCDALRALAESKIRRARDESVTDIIDDARKWLLNNQGVVEDGRGWGWRRTDEDQKLVASTVDNTAFALIGLLKAGQSARSVAIQQGISWLLYRQSENGDWKADTPRVMLSLAEYLSIVQSS
jgi:hypothetical protein